MRTVVFVRFYVRRTGDEKVVGVVWKSFETIQDRFSMSFWS